MAELLDRLKTALEGHYDVECVIGRGGSATVFLARDLKHSRSVAIKVLKPEMAAVVGPERFLKEIEIASSFSHPHIVPLLDSGASDGLLYYVMPHVEGESLRDRLNREKQLPVDDAVDIVRDVARALEYAHERGVLHRDIKPENILLEAGEAVVADFGIARAIEGGDGLTATGVAIGTPPYMSPEQASGELQLDVRSDLYSLGCVLYEMLAGKPPFTGSTAESILNQHRTAEVPKITGVRSRVPAELESILSRMLAKAPADRHATPRDLIHALSRESTSTSIPPPAPVQWRRLLALGFGVGITGMAVLLIGVNAGGLRDRLLGGPAQAEIGSLAVLPLENLSRDPDQDYFADGMTEVLTAELGKIHSLMVISRTSAMRYKDTDKSIPEIGRELNVDAVIEGSVLRVRDQIRITAQLIHAPSDQHLWAENYVRDLRDVMSLQGEVARDIARQVQGNLTPSEAARLGESSPVEPAALDAYLKGMSALGKGTTEGYREAQGYFEQAIEIDPDYARAHLGMATCYSAYAASNILPSEEALPLAEAAAKKALALDGTLAEAHARLGWVYVMEWNWSAAEREITDALELNPNSSRAYSTFSQYLSCLGRHEEAIASSKHAQELDPLSASTRITLGSRYYFARRYDEAVQQFQEALDMGRPDAHYWLGETYLAMGQFEQAITELKEHLRRDKSPDDAAFLASAYAAAGMEAEARAILNELLERAEHEHVGPQSVAGLFGYLGEMDPAFQWLEKAYDTHNFYLSLLKVAPVYDPLRSDPRFDDLVRRVGLAGQ